MSQAIATINKQQSLQGHPGPLTLSTLDEFVKLSEMLARSGYFSDVREASQAFVKVLYGSELGFGPITAMTGVHIIQNKPTLSANLIAATIKRSDRYDFKVLDLDNEKCEIEFFENGRKLTPTSVFTWEDATRAQLTTGKNSHTWKAYPRNMLFARAIGNGARWHCSGIFGGPIYTPDELGAAIDGETGEAIDIEATPINTTVEAPKPAQVPTPAQPEATHNEDIDDDSGWQIEKHTRIRVFSLCQELEKLGVKPEAWRKRMLKEVGAKSRKDLTGPKAAALMMAFASWITDLKRMDLGDEEPELGPSREELQQEIEKATRCLNRDYSITFARIRAKSKELTGKEKRAELTRDESVIVRDALQNWIAELEAEAQADAESERAAMAAESEKA